MTTDLVKESKLEKQMERQMGCMAGFLQLFDRHHILNANKRLYSPKCLPPSSFGDTRSESEKSTPSTPRVSLEFVKQVTPEPTLPLPIFEIKQGTKSSWKFIKETPRLSLDSRAITDAKGGLHPKDISTSSTSILSSPSDSNATEQHNRSPSVIARLMGLEPLSPNSRTCDERVVKKPELRRSASESRLSRELFQSRFATSMETNSLVMVDKNVKNPCYSKNVGKVEPVVAKGVKYISLAPWRVPNQRKSFFDVFPEPKHGEIENRLRMRGIEEPSKDLETLKQILEALQLKGLLHSRREQDHRNFVYENDSPIVVMKTCRMSVVNKRTTRNGYAPSSNCGHGNQVRGFRNENSQSVKSPRRDRSVKSPIQTQNNGHASVRKSNSLVKPKPLSTETQRRVNVSPIQSPKPSPRRTGQDPMVKDRSIRNKKSTSEIRQKEKISNVVLAEDESSSSVSGSSFTTSTDTERSKNECKDGRTLLERCDKLLNSIEEMNTEQPSPVSVLDSSFYKDDLFTPSPVTTKRNIHFKDQSVEWEEELWSPVILPSQMKSDDCDFIYISDVMRASRFLPEDSDVFSLVEKQQYLKGNDTSKVSRLQRKLIFDTINEIIDRYRLLPPWKQTNENDLKFNKVWSEFQKIRNRDGAEDLFEIICGVLKKDLAGDATNGWGDCPMEISEAVLDIERLIFKDLISETIHNLVADATLSSSVMPKRKLVF